MDFGRSAELLHIIEKAAGHPKLKALADMAAAELEAINEEAIKENEKRVAEAKRKTEQAEAERVAAANRYNLEQQKQSVDRPNRLLEERIGQRDAKASVEEERNRESMRPKAIPAEDEEGMRR